MSKNSHIPEATERSTALFLSFPPEILQSIFHLLFSEEIYNPCNEPNDLSRTPRPLRFRTLILKTKDIRGVCSSWAHVAKSLIFRGKASRGGTILKLPRLFSREEVRTFPLLRDCKVQLCHPYSFRDLRTLQRELAESAGSLEYICAVCFREDDLMSMMMGKTSSMGYGRFADVFVDTFAATCVAAGLPIATGRERDGSSTGSGIAAGNKNEPLAEEGIAAIENFFFKETLALWYFNAQILGQILSMFPCLERLELPEFLLPALLAKPEYFFPDCDSESDNQSPFAAVNATPPQMPGNLEIEYHEQQRGRPFSDIVDSVRFLDIRTHHFNPILALFTGFSDVPFRLWRLIWQNGWWGEDIEIRYNVVDRLKERVCKAVDDIPERNKPRSFDVQVLKEVMDEPVER